MSYTKNAHKLSDKSSTDQQATDTNYEGEINCNPIESRTYAVTVSKKLSASGEEEAALCSGQKSFISMHSTDQLCQMEDIENSSNLEECNVEILSLNEVFPSTSEESLSNDESPVQKKQRNLNKNKIIQKTRSENAGKSSYVPTNSKSSIMSGILKDPGEGQPSVYSDFDIPKSTLYVMGSNPGEPKMSYQDPPKKISKTMKKFLRNIDKHKNDQNSKSNDKALSKLTTMRGILKDGRCGPECTGDSVQDDINTREINCNPIESRTYAVTVSKKLSASGEEEAALCSGQKSFISIHSTDQLCQMEDIENSSNLEECNVEILSLNEVFPSTSEESLSNDESPVQKKQRNLNKNKIIQKTRSENAGKSSYVPTNSKSSIMSGILKDPGEGQPSVYSDFDIPKSTLYVMGSNPGEPKMSYQDPPKKISKTMKKFLRNIDKHKNDQNSKSNDKALSKLTTMRGILKDGRCGPECTGDSVQDDINTQELTLPFPMDFGPQTNYSKPNPDKNVTFNTQVVIIHFTGDLCVGQSLETLSKEKDQQARNSELRKTFLTKYNEFWPTQK